MSTAVLDWPAAHPPRPCRPALHIDVARDLDSLMRVFALRSLVFMGEQACPYEEEFDCVDLSGVTHVLAQLGSEPAGTMRLRWFADFVKVERVLVRYEHRGDANDVAKHMVTYGLDLARRRGYRRALAFAQVRLAGFWGRMGFTPRPGRERFVFSDHEYLELEARLAQHPAALSMEDDPFVLMRPDGRWDAPGAIDRSAARPASNPHR